MTTVCRVGYVVGSALLGMIGIVVGWLVDHTGEMLRPFFRIDGVGGILAARLLAIAGVGYSICRASCRQHSHALAISDESGHGTFERLTPWVLSTIFVVALCDPLMGRLMHSVAAARRCWNLVLVTAVLWVTTLVNMTVIGALLQLRTGTFRVGMRRTRQACGCWISTDDLWHRDISGTLAN